MKRSRCYITKKEELLKEAVSPAEAVDFFFQQNKKKVDKLKVSFSLQKKRNKGINMGKKKCFLPFLPKKKIILVLSDGFSAKTIAEVNKTTVKNYPIEVVNKQELKDKLLKKSGKVNKKRVELIFKLFCCVDSESVLNEFKKTLSVFSVYPNKSNGCLATDADLIEKIKKSQSEIEQVIKADKDGNFNLLVGNLTDEKGESNRDYLLQNFFTLREAVVSLRPNGWKGFYLKKIALSTVMGPSLSVNIKAIKQEKF